MEDLYKSPTINEMKELFGDELQEEKVEHRESDVKDFIKLLDKARNATKKHSIRFG